jgi:hypothetical protein
MGLEYHLNHTDILVADPVELSTFDHCRRTIQLRRALRFSHAPGPIARAPPRGARCWTQPASRGSDDRLV